MFNLTQKGKVLTGTGGPPDQQWEVAKGAVNAGKATFEVQQPNGPLFKFTLTIVKGRLQGDMIGERDGVVRGHAKVDAAKAAKAAGEEVMIFSLMRAKRPLREPVREAPAAKPKNYITPAGLAAPEGRTIGSC